MKVTDKTIQIEGGRSITTRGSVYRHNRMVRKIKIPMNKPKRFVKEE